MIGFATWGSIEMHEVLEVKTDSINYGYITREPVDYTATIGKEKKSAPLEENHSHFILVFCRFVSCCDLPKVVDSVFR